MHMQLNPMLPCHAQGALHPAAARRNATMLCAGFPPFAAQPNAAVPYVWCHQAAAQSNAAMPCAGCPPDVAQPTVTMPWTLWTPPRCSSNQGFYAMCRVPSIKLQVSLMLPYHVQCALPSAAQLNVAMPYSGCFPAAAQLKTAMLWVGCPPEAQQNAAMPCAGCPPSSYISAQWCCYSVL